MKQRSKEPMALMAGIRRLCVALWASTLLFCGSSLFGGSLGGRITNVVTGSGIQGEKITARTNSQAVGYAFSGDAGVFRFDELPDGEYSVSTTRSPTVTVKVSGETHLDFKVAARASVRGIVLDPDGKEAEGIIVHLGPERSMTDERGSFVFEDVEPASYTLYALTPEAAVKDGQKIVGVEYPGRVNVERTDLSGYTIQLRRVAVRHVRGVVTPAAVAEVRLVKPPMPRGLWVYGSISPMEKFAQGELQGMSVKTAEDGSFEIADVPEGEWVLQADLIQRYSETDVLLTPQKGSSTIRVAKEDVGDVNIHLVNRFSIAVTPDWGGEGPNRFDKLPVVIPLEGERGFPGRYWILPQTIPGFYLAAAMLDGRDEKGQVVEMERPAEVRMIYKSDGGAVIGRVENGASAAVIMMVDASTGPRIGYSAKCDEAGAFAIRDVAPGGYTIAGFRDGDEIRSGSFLDKLYSGGERVEVEAASTVAVELRIR